MRLKELSVVIGDILLYIKILRNLPKKKKSPTVKTTGTESNSNEFRKVEYKINRKIILFLYTSMNNRK